MKQETKKDTKKLRYEEASGKTLEERREAKTDREAKQETVL